MKSITGALLTATLCLMTTLPAHAGYDHNGKRVTQRIQLQQQRILHGIENGQLNRDQASVLKHKQRKMRKLKMKFGRDGHYSHAERRVLTRKLNKTSKLIRKLKHDDIKAGPDRYRKHDYRSNGKHGRIGKRTRSWPRIGYLR
jgi:hypothetical protein